MNQDPTSLERLHDIVPSPSLPLWPPAPGWYWILGLLGVMLLALLLRAFARWQHNRYRREALAELAHQEVALRVPAARPAAFVALAELLKRTAVTAFPRNEVATLTGREWFEFLDRTGQTTAFARDNGEILERAAYDPRSATNISESKVDELLSLVRHWISHHREPVIKGARI